MEPPINHIREHTFFSQRKINFVIKLNASISEDVMVEIMASPGWGNSNKTDFALNVTIFYLDKTPFISPVSYHVSDSVLTIDSSHIQGTTNIQ